MKLGLKHRKFTFATKIDFDSAFRIFPLKSSILHLMGLTLDKEFFVNCNLAFGGKSSCKIFEEFANSIQWLIKTITQSKDLSHYLDDFIMINQKFHVCKHYMTTMQSVCKNIRAPLSEKKTEGPKQVIGFLGFILDFIRQVIQIPEEKINKATILINQMLSTGESKGNSKWKVSVHQLQQLTGLLNFLCRAVPAGRPFLGRMYKLISQAAPAHLRNTTYTPNPNFKIHLNQGVVEDLHAWLDFLTNDNFQIHREVPFTSFLGKHEKGPLIYADASGKSSLGWGSIFPKKRMWMYGKWHLSLFAERKPSIQLLELYALVVAVDVWVLLLQNKQIRLRSDNWSTVCELNKNLHAINTD